jgi:hypothetical protein
MLRAGVDLGVERGVEFGDKKVIGRDSCRLSKFSFSSGTIVKDERVKSNNKSVE